MNYTVSHHQQTISYTQMYQTEYRQYHLYTIGTELVLEHYTEEHRLLYVQVQTWIQICLQLGFYLTGMFWSTIISHHRFHSLPVWLVISDGKLNQKLAPPDFSFVPRLSWNELTLVLLFYTAQLYDQFYYTINNVWRLHPSYSNQYLRRHFVNYPEYSAWKTVSQADFTEPAPESSEELLPYLPYLLGMYIWLFSYVLITSVNFFGAY